MIAVEQWTGEEALLLRSVMRLSVREFADHLGINPRTVSYWGKNRSAVCRPLMAQTLDTALQQCTPAEQEAFRQRLATLRGEAVRASEQDPAARPAPCTVVSHKFLPVYLGHQQAEVLLAAGKEIPPGPGGLRRSTLTAEHRQSAQTSTVHAYACGVAVVHMEDQRTVASLTDLALWRYRTYQTDPAWAGSLITQLLVQLGGHPGVASSPNPQYVLSAYELREHAWTGGSLHTALQLLATPSVLVNRQDPQHIMPLAPGVEDAHFRDGWTHPEALPIEGGVSHGVVGWSGLSYCPQSHERALAMSQIVAMELDVQALWALATHILHLVEEGLDPVMPEDYGWRFLRGAYIRLTTARPTETAQHRTMREAILATSELPDRLRAAQEVLRDGI